MMTTEDVPNAWLYDCDITVEHIVIKCQDFAEVKQIR